MTTNEELVQTLIAANVLRTERIIQAFGQVDRAHFVSAAEQIHAYEDRPLPTAAGQTISQPTTVAIMLEAVQPTLGERVLDIGAGSGWVTALLATLVGPAGRVTAIERIGALVQPAIVRLSRFSFPQLRVEVGDASRGWPADAPYDVIHVAAAAPQLPEQLPQQLAVGGRLIIPIGEPIQDLALITKKRDNTFTERRIPGFQFVPLIDEHV